MTRALLLGLIVLLPTGTAYAAPPCAVVSHLAGSARYEQGKVEADAFTDKVFVARFDPPSLSSWDRGSCKRLDVKDVPDIVYDGQYGAPRSPANITLVCSQGTTQALPMAAEFWTFSADATASLTQIHLGYTTAPDKMGRYRGKWAATQCAAP